MLPDLLKGKFMGGKEMEEEGEEEKWRGGEMERRTNKRRGRSEVGLGNEATEIKQHFELDKPYLGRVGFPWGGGLS